MFKAERGGSAIEEIQRKIEEKKLEEEQGGLVNFLIKRVEEFRKENPEASIKEIAEFIVLERKKRIYGEKGERENDINAIRQDFLEERRVRTKVLEKGWFGITLNSRTDILPRSIMRVIGTVYPEYLSDVPNRDWEAFSPDWDEAVTAAAEALQALADEETDKLMGRKKGSD